jgi:predicted ArsR family transcriptional regulator
MRTRPWRGLADVMTRGGFDPEIRRRASRADIVLGRCPFQSAAVADPQVVCELHRGMAEGLVEDSDDVAVEDSSPRIPGEPSCRLQVRLNNTVCRADMTRADSRMRTRGRALLLRTRSG